MSSQPQTKGTPMTEKTHLKLRPCNDFVHLARIEPEAKSGLIFIPEAARQAERRARVLAVGPGRWSEDGKSRIPIPLKVGDVVLLPFMRGSDIAEDGSSTGAAFVMHESELLAVEEA